MQIRDDTDGIGAKPVQTLYPVGLANGVYDSVNGLPGCVGSTELISTCNNPKYNWVYYEFDTFCNKQVKYTFLSGNTAVLTEGCWNLYPATISSSFVDSSDPIPLINGEVCDGTNVVYGTTSSPTDSHAFVRYEPGALDDCETNPTCKTFMKHTCKIESTGTKILHNSPSYFFVCNFYP